MSKFLKAISKDYVRGLVISLISVLVVVPLTCLLIFIPLGVVSRSDASIWVLIVPAGLYLLIMLGGTWGAVGWSLYRRKRWLDSVFAPLGLTGSAYTISGRQYQGVVQGREVTVRFYRGPTLDLYVSTPLQTRFGRQEIHFGVDHLCARAGQLHLGHVPVQESAPTPFIEGLLELQVLLRVGQVLSRRLQPLESFVPGQQRFADL